AMSISSMNNPGFTLVRIEGNLPINGNALELTTQESATGIKLILGYSPNRIHGRVEILGGVQPRSISVEVAPVQNDGLTALRFADVDSTGAFSIEGVFPRQYKLVATAIFVPFPMTSPDGVLLRNKVKTSSRIVTVVQGQDVEVTITIDPNQN